MAGGEAKTAGPDAALLQIAPAGYGRLCVGPLPGAAVQTCVDGVAGSGLGGGLLDGENGLAVSGQQCCQRTHQHSRPNLEVHIGEVVIEVVIQ